MAVMYILTNPSMPNLVKIGCTDRSIEERLRELSRPSSVPMPFECFMAVDLPVDHYQEFEKALHHAFGDKRVNAKREFFELAPDKPAAILKIASQLAAGRNVTPQQDVVEDAEELDALNRERTRRSKFRFSQAGIPQGAVVVSSFDNSQTAEVIGDRKIRFRGEETSLTKAALMIAHETGRNWATIAGPQFWTYEGRSLTEIREEVEDILS